MTDEQQKAYDWAKSHDYASVAARYAKTLASAVEDLQAHLAMKEGRWKKSKAEITNWECSNCGFQTGEPWGDPNKMGRLAYCPHCGCRMPAAKAAQARKNSDK